MGALYPHHASYYGPIYELYAPAEEDTSGPRNGCLNIYWSDSFSSSLVCARTDNTGDSWKIDTRQCQLRLSILLQPPSTTYHLSIGLRTEPGELFPEYWIDINLRLRRNVHIGGCAGFSIVFVD